MKLLPFVLIAVLHMVGIFLENENLSFWTKPFLMPALAFWYWTNAKQDGVKAIILVALGFSTLGDVALLFSKQVGRENWFLVGLGFFLIAHVAYIFAFSKLVSLKNGRLKKQPLVAIPVLIYLCSFVAYLWPNLSPDFLKIPVLLYASVISTMLLLVLNSQGFIQKNVALSLLLGATLFVLSDSAIAVHKFVSPFLGANIFIMTTYILGQYFLVKEL